jgi:glycosyltransferase involved in cell wall biosynthesis
VSTEKTLHDDVCLVGHPYTPIGMGETVRATFRSLRKVAVQPKLADIYKLEQPDPAELAEFSGSCLNSPAGINVFHINGNEVEQVWNHLNYKRPWTGYNVIYPLWELPRYPAEWAEQLNRFDEIWAPSRFIFDSLRKVCDRPVYHMPFSCEIVLNGFLGRRYFSIPEADYASLFFYDVRSYTSRKNPQGVIRAFRRLLAQRPYSKARLVIKVNGVETNPAAVKELSAELYELRANTTLIQRGMSSNEVKNLVRCCDCFISLHRSEGIGLGMAQAMALGKPVIGTAYSGNMDFMNSSVAFCVDYKLIPVKKDEYPHYEDQVWADPDVDQAGGFLTQLVDDPGYGREVGVRARLHMQCEFGYRPIGLNYVNRLDTIRAAIA